MNLLEPCEELDLLLGLGRRQQQLVEVNAQSLWLAQACQVMRQYMERRGLCPPPSLYVAVRPIEVEATIGLYCQGTGPGGAAVIEVHENLRQAEDVLATLLHELIHASDAGESAHGQWFADWATALGLAGPTTSTYASSGLLKTLREFVRRLPPYPSPGAFTITLNGEVWA